MTDVAKAFPTELVLNRRSTIAADARAAARQAMSAATECAALVQTVGNRIAVATSSDHHAVSGDHRQTALQAARAAVEAAMNGAGVAADTAARAAAVAADAAMALDLVLVGSCGQIEVGCQLRPWPH